jgi:hypothetical protein
MARYIDADKIPYYLDTSENAPMEGRRVAFKSDIDKIPTADVVEVVRCKDCKHCTLTEDGEYNPEDIVCGYFMTDGMNSTDFCSYGERKDGDE